MRRHMLRKHAAKLSRPLRHNLLRERRLGGKQVSVPVIVRFGAKLTAARLHAMRRYAGIRRHQIIRRLPLLNALASNVSVRSLRRMCAWKGVRKVYLDSVKKTTLDIATPSIGSAAVAEKRGLTGKGTRIAIIDTGVFPHPDLTRPVNRIAAFRDFVNGRKRPYDDNGHGTHVAGDAAGNGWSSGGLFRGPAPQADIVAVKAFDRNGEAYDSAIIQAIEWCIANRKRLRLRVLSMSFGGPAHGSCADDPLCQAIRKAVKAGLVVVAAAGNSGPRRGTIESPGNCRAAITVGAVDDRRSLAQADDRAAPFSSRGPAACARNKPDLAAPGDSIVSLRAPMSQLDRAYPFLRVGGAYFVLSGTSMSTPLVAGAVAQLLQRCPSLTPGRVKTLLKRHAFRLGAGADAVGSGELDTRFLLRRNGKKGACRRNATSTRPKRLQKSKPTETPE